MASRITCITKPDAQSSHEHITHVGGIRQDGSGFYITREQCANDIDALRETYYVMVRTAQANVTTYNRNGVKFIRTVADRTLRDNLLSLPQC